MSTTSKFFIPFFTFLLISGCSFVELTPGAEHIILSNDETSCKRIGETTVTVIDTVLYLERTKTAVEEELQILAQNAAQKMGGNAIWPESQTNKGSRSYSIFRCKAYPR